MAEEPAPASTSHDKRQRMTKMLEKIPEFNKKRDAQGGMGLSAASLGLGDHRSKLEVLVIILVAVVIIGGAELWLYAFNVQIGRAHV